MSLICDSAFLNMSYRIHRSYIIYIHWQLCNWTTPMSVSALDCSQEEKVSLYRSLLEKLPPVNYVTTRRLTGHLYRIHQQCERNSMPADNLAAVWGPTLMHIEAQQVNILVLLPFFSPSKRNSPTCKGLCSFCQWAKHRPNPEILFKLYFIWPLYKE